MLDVLVCLFLAATRLQAPTSDLTHVRLAAQEVRASVRAHGDESTAARRDEDAFKRAVRDWVESQLSAEPREYARAQRRIEAELAQAGLLKNAENESFEDLQSEDRYGTIRFVQVTTDSAFPHGLVVTVGVGVPCGADEAVYAYRWTKSGILRVFEAARTSAKFGETGSQVRFSAPDANGNRLALVTSLGVQCASNWNGIRYQLFRVSNEDVPATQVIDGDHSCFECDERLEAAVGRDEFTIELRDHSIDLGLHNRTHYLRYHVSADSARRVDPVALQPQDFVDEWVTRPWEEMKLRTAEAARPPLRKWHQALHADFVAGTLTLAQPCKGREQVWQLAVQFDESGGQRIPSPREVFFLVRDRGGHAYEMIDVSPRRQSGCPGNGQPSSESAWRLLSPTPAR